jgi:hypothetical protein
MNFKAQQAIYDRDLMAVEPEMPCQCRTAGGFMFQARKGQGSTTYDGQDAGFMQVADFDIVVRTSAFTDPKTIPDPEDALDVMENGVYVAYRVKVFNNSSDNVSITLSLKKDS